MRYSMRQAEFEDREPMMRISHDGLRAYVEEVWGWNQDEQEERFREHFDLRQISILELCGRDVGYLKVEEKADHVFLSGIYIDSKHRGQGLGSAVVMDLVERFSTDSRPIRLQVLLPNPARRFYERLGFDVTETTSTHVKMEFIGPKSP